MSKRKPHGLVTVYAAANETLKELYGGTTSLLLHKLEKRHSARKPARLKNWKPEHAIVYRALVYSLPRRETAAYLRRWRKRVPDGWTVI